jgi:hypothetical protein
VYGQTSSAFPSIYTNYRDDKERGDDHSLYLLDKIVLNTSKNIVIGPPFIPQLIDQTQSTFKVQKTYMVGGYRILNDLNQNKQNVALPMRKSINGWGKIGTFQTGNTKP